VIHPNHVNFFHGGWRWGLLAAVFVASFALAPKQVEITRENGSEMARTISTGCPKKSSNSCCPSLLSSSFLLPQ
jgi:hypothetical protein